MPERCWGLVRYRHFVPYFTSLKLAAGPAYGRRTRGKEVVAGLSMRWPLEAVSSLLHGFKILKKDA